MTDLDQGVGGRRAGVWRWLVRAMLRGGTCCSLLGGMASAAAASQPTPPPLSTTLATECATPKTEWIWCDDFETDRLHSYFAYDSAGGRFTRVASVGNKGSMGMRARWTAGVANAGALQLAFGKTPQTVMRPVDAGTANLREIYWRVYVRYQPGWVGGGGDKLTRAMVLASPTSFAQAMIAQVWSAEREYLALEGARGTDADGALLTTKLDDIAHLTWLGVSRSKHPIFDKVHLGTWLCVEAHVDLNDQDSSGGFSELWIDNELEARKTRLNWLGNFDAYGINAIFLENYWYEGAPVAEERYLDNFVVSTKRIGC